MSEIRQRRTGGINADGSRPLLHSQNDKNGKDKAPVTPTGSSAKRKEFPLIPMALVLGFALLVLLLHYRKYGISMFIDRSYFDLTYSPSEWRSLLADKTVLFIGGPHRGGTTILWKTISAHPDVSGLGSTFKTGGDHSEGILIQDVYPKYGVGLEKVMKNQPRFQRKMLGVGRYALGDEDEVHLTETDERITPNNTAKVLNRFGQYWNLSKSVLVEKSPPTAVMSRFLQALYNVNITDSVPASSSKLGVTTKFLFITRHPIANAYAHHKLLGGAGVVPFDTLLQNYIQLHRYMLADIPHLENDPLLIRLEDFVNSPATELVKICNWLGVDSSDELVQDLLENRIGATISTDPNAKYRAMWCRAGSQQGNRVRAALAEQYQQQIDQLDLGYDLKGWCEEGGV